MSEVTLQQNQPDRYARIRAGFALKGSSLHSWCRTHSVDPHNARKAILGVWTGPAAVALVSRIVEASGAEGFR